MDGCSELRIFAQIVIPLSLPIFATIGLFYAVGHWNSYFGPLIYLHDKEKYPLQIILQQIVIAGQMSFAELNQTEGVIPFPENIKYATIMVATLPILMVYPFLQKYFIKGVLIGSVKG